VLKNGASGYLDLISDEDYLVRPSATKSGETGYLKPVDDSPGPEHSYLVLAPSPPPSHDSDVEHKQIGTDPISSPGANTGYLTPFEDCAAGDDGYLHMSAAIESPDE